MKSTDLKKAGQKVETPRQEHIDKLFIAELQFRLASAVRLATSLKTQPLDLPVQWSHGKHLVSHEEIALRADQADFAACFLHRSATYLMAVAIKDAIKAVFSDPKNSTDPNVQSAYQIARLIRNAFAHNPFEPQWSIDPDCRDKIFSIPDVATLDTHKIDGKPFDWRHYGGPLALLQLCRYVRSNVLGGSLQRTKEVPAPKTIIYQQGDLILKRIARIPANAKPLPIKRRKDGKISLGGGHYIS